MSKQYLWLRPRSSSLKSLLAPAVVALSLATAAASAQTYTVVDVATIDEASTVVVRGVKAGETAVGGGRLTGARRGLLFGRGGVSDFEGLPGTDNTIAFGINDQDDRRRRRQRGRRRARVPAHPDGDLARAGTARRRLGERGVRRQQPRPGGRLLERPERRTRRRVVRRRQRRRLAGHR